MADVWECVLADPVAPAPPPPPPSSGGPAGRPGGGPAEPRADPSDQPAPGTARAQLLQFDLEEVFDAIRSRVTRDDAARRLLGELAPPSRGRGALVGALIDGRRGLPYGPDSFLTPEHLAWVPEAQLRARFPDLERRDPETAGFLARAHPDRCVLLVCVGAEGEQARAATGEPYLLLSGFFGRWVPGGVYISEEHLRETGELRLSKLCGSGPGPAEARVAVTAVDVCALADRCPSLQAYVAALGCGGGAAPAPQLKECGRCRRVKYCGAACQRLDWPRHKKECGAQRERGPGAPP